MITPMLMLMTGALAGVLDVEECTNQGTYAIAGGAGYHNGLEALRVQAATYGASAFAERSLFPAVRARQGFGFVAIYELNQAYNVARVPTWSTEEECPDEYRFATRPLDLTAANIGVALRYARVSAFYSAGSIYGTAGETTQITRVPISIISPLVAGAALGLSGVAGSRHVVNGTSAIAIDAMGGATVDLTIIQLRAAWAASQGLFLSAGQDRVGLFGNALVKPTEGAGVPQAEAGARRVRWGDVSDTIGRTSVWGRKLPLAETLSTAAAGEPIDLITGHFEQTDIGRRYDVGVTLSKEPELGVYEGHAAVHSPGYYEVSHDEAESKPSYFLVRAGMVRMPTQWYYGLSGGTYIQARVEGSFPLGESTDSQATVGLLFNDAELLALYPFAVNALAWRMSVRGVF